MYGWSSGAWSFLTPQWSLELSYATNRPGVFKRHNVWQRALTRHTLWRAPKCYNVWRMISNLTKLNFTLPLYHRTMFCPN